MRIRKVKQQLDKDERTLLESVLCQDAVFKDIPLNKLYVDYSYQTRPREQLLAQIAEQFSSAMLGTLIVSKRPDGTMWVCDGVTRKLALEQRGEAGREVRCQVLNCTDAKQEALLFKFYNGSARRAVPLASRLQAEGIAGVDHGFLNLVEQCGFALVGSTNRTLKGIGYVYKAFNQDPEALKKALFALKSTWWASRLKLDGNTILGVTLVYCSSRNVDADVRKFLEHTPPDKLDELINTVWGGGKKSLKAKLHPSSRPHFVAKAIGLSLNRKRHGRVVNLDRLDEMRIDAVLQ